MMNSVYKKYVIPGSKGLVVRFPRDKVVLPEVGAWVPWIGSEGRYWRRRLKCGDVKWTVPPIQKIEKTEKKRGNKK